MANIYVQNALPSTYPVSNSYLQTLKVGANYISASMPYILRLCSLFLLPTELIFRSLINLSININPNRASNPVWLFQSFTIIYILNLIAIPFVFLYIFNSLDSLNFAILFLFTYLLFLDISRNKLHELIDSKEKAIDIASAAIKETIEKEKNIKIQATTVDTLINFKKFFSMLGQKQASSLDFQYALMSLIVSLSRLDAMKKSRKKQQLIKGLEADNALTLKFLAKASIS